MKYKNIVWDWNGTLLNDLEVGVTTLNDMLERRKLPLLTCRQYKDKFGFPVADFYREVGFDLKQESLHDVSVDFVETYNRYAEKLELNEQVCEVLETIQGAQIKQYVLSALREDCWSRWSMILILLSGLIGFAGPIIFMRKEK